MNENFVTLDGITNKIFNFKKTLKITDSLIWKNCKNVKISIKSKINKLIVINSKNLKIKIGNTISGIEIENSENIKIKFIKNTSVKHLNSYKSNIKINLNENKKENTLYNIEKSTVNFY